MQTRPLGQTGHESSILTFGAIALNFLEQPGADEMVETVLGAGVNHVDVAPILDAASRFEPMDEEEQAVMVQTARENDTPVPME